MPTPFEKRRWLVIPASIVNSINFDQVHEFNETSLRYSLDGTQTFVKYDINIVEQDIVQTLLNPETMVEETFTTPAGVYGRPSFWNESYPELTHSEILELLATEDWSEQTTAS